MREGKKAGKKGWEGRKVGVRDGGKRKRRKDGREKNEE